MAMIRVRGFMNLQYSNKAGFISRRKGNGWQQIPIREVHPSEPDYIRPPDAMDCDRCGGDGLHPDYDDCPTCKGKGWLSLFHPIPDKQFILATRRT